MIVNAWMKRDSTSNTISVVSHGLEKLLIVLSLNIIYFPKVLDFDSSFFFFSTQTMGMYKSDIFMFQKYVAINNSKARLQWKLL